MKKLYNNYINIKALMLVMLMSVFALGAYAQSIDGFDVQPPDVQYYLNDDTDASVELQTSGTFPDGTVFYLHTGTSGTDFTEEDVLASVNDPADAIDFVWSTVGVNVNHFVSAATGDFDSETIEIGTTASIAAGALAGSTYNMNGVGERKITTQAYDLSSSEEIIFFVSFNATNVVEDRPLRVQFSTNGTDWTNMTDADASENEWFGGAFNLRFVLTSGQKSTSTQFRIIQEGKDDYTPNVENWTLDGSASNFDIEIGGLNVVDNALVGAYDIAYPTTSITFFKDDNENTPVTYYAGMDVEVEGLFTGATDQVDEYEYTAVFENGDTRFLLEDAAGVNNNNDLSITGTIPADIEYGLTWSVTIRAYNGGTPTLGVDENLLTNIDREGYNMGASEFDADGDRFAISEPVDVQSTTNAQIDLQLVKKSAGLSPAGTEIVLEYTTDGSEFTQVGDPISLNADLSETLEFDLSAESGIISSGTQFRVRQLSNNGLDLDTWDILVFNLFAGGNILFDQQEVDYIPSNKDIEAPVIALDPVSVPDELIFPGDEVTLVYNVTDGAFPDGTELTAVFDGGDFNYNVGTSSLIAPGADEDHEITITIPPVVESLSMYDVFLVSTTGAESNSRIIPVYNTNITITDVASDNGVFDGTIDVIYPGDQITVNYLLDGSVGVGGELFLEVLDYGDPDTGEDDEFVVLNSATGAAIDGDISGNLPTNINYDDPGAVTVRLRVGNGLLANMSVVFAQYDDMGTLTDINSVSVGDAGVDAELLFDVESFEGNNPNNIDNFIGSGERSFNTLAYEMPFGGRITIVLNEVNSSYDEPQTVLLQASNDGGQSFTTIAEEEYEGTNVTFDGAVDLPEALWGEEVIFKVIYNEEGESGEFVNELDIATLTVEFNDFGTANSQEFNISGQFRRPTIYLEDLTGETSYIVGEQVEVEYTTEGVFPGNTEFALLFVGNLNDDGTDPDDFDDGNFDDGDDFETVVATSADQGQGTFTFTVPDMAFEGDGTNSSLDLYDNLEVIAYNATGGADYMPNEDIDVDEDEQFLVIEGTDDEDGAYTFDKEGDRSLLTQAFDLSSADEVILSFSFSDVGIQVTDNQLTIPVLQVSIDAGETFQNIAVDDESLIGDGYLFNDNAYEVSVPAEFITDATHFRWYQALNLGADQDVWTVSGITITLVNGNEISTFYAVERDMQALSVSHPSLAEYELSQVDPDDAVFNGETVELSFDKVFESTPDFPSAAEFTYLLFEPTSGKYVIDPETDEPLVIGTSDDIGAFTATIPFYVVNNSYEIHILATKETEEGTYYYAGSSDGGVNVGTLDIFLRVVETSIDFDSNDILYAGSTVTFNISIENDETNLEDNSDIFANLLVEDYDGTNRDLLLASQNSVTDPFNIDLPPYLRGNFNFVIEFSEGTSLGNPGEIVGDASNLAGLEDDQDNWLSGENSDLGFKFIDDDEDNFTIGISDGSVVSSEDDDDNGFEEIETEIFSNLNYAGVNRVSFNLNSVSQSDFNVLLITEDGTTLLDNFTTPVVTIGVDTAIFYDYNLPEEVINAESVQVRIEETGDGTDFFINAFSFTNTGAFVSLFTFENDLGRGLITTKDFDAEEMANVNLLSFDLSFVEIPENMLDNQFLIVEYSTDGGQTYSTLSTIPSPEESELTVYENFTLVVPQDARGVNTRFRWRQEERAGILVYLDNVSLLEGRTLPFDYVSVNQTVSNQQVLVTDVSEDEICLDGTFTLDYEVRGRMGSDNIVTLSYRDIENNIPIPLNEEFNAFEGTGTVDITLPTDLFDGDLRNKVFEFRFNYDDNTFADISFDTRNTEYSGNGPFSEAQIEVVSPIDVDLTTLSLNGNTPENLACEGGDLWIDINNPQPDFMYEIIDESGAVLGTFVNDGESNPTVNIGSLAAFAELGVRITSMSSTGNTTCNTLESSNTLEIEYRTNFELLQVRSFGDDDVYEANDQIDVCEGAEFSFAPTRFLNNNSAETATAAEIEWFKDDVNTPLTVAGSVLGEADIDGTGSYFARITEGSCVYLTNAIQINVTEVPEQPTVAVTGNLKSCEGENAPVLAAPEGFAYYQWSTPDSSAFDGATSRTIQGDVTGFYSVEVSNLPFEIDNGGCPSDPSLEVFVERYEQPELELSTTDDIVENASVIVDGDEFEFCEEEQFQVWFFDNGSLIPETFTIEIFRDGNSVGFVENTSSVVLDSAGTYNFVLINDNEGQAVSCNVNSVSFTINPIEIPGRPTITVAGSTEFCELGGSAVITAPAGHAIYEWSFDGTTIVFGTDGFNAVNNTLEVTRGGTYTVRVGDAEGCLSPASNQIEIEERDLPHLVYPISIDLTDGPRFYQFDASCGDGPVTFVVGEGPSNPTSNLYTYQLVEAISGQPSGAAVRGNGGELLLTSDPISVPTDFYVEVAYADGAGCANSDPNLLVEANNNNVVLEVEGHELVATISEFDRIEEIRWFRNGVEMRNRNGFEQIGVTDAAEYQVEVDFTGGCAVFSNIVSIENQAPTRSTFFGEQEINTYPNPSTDAVNVSLNGGPLGEYDISIMSMSGQVVISKKVNKSEEEHIEILDIQSLEKGIYNLRIQRGNKVDNFRIVKQ